ncbi:MAG: hypothetical protein DRO18_03665 [Thermoprotei archaeon]|nr:MAG: hypothetical protein DRO18_03665 [Thermoprotei archaeon]
MTRVEFTRKLVQLAMEMIQAGERFFFDYLKRSDEEQFRLFKKGRKQLPDGTWVIEDKSKVVTYIDGIHKKGKHQRGLAVDIYFVNEDGTLCWDRAKYEYWHKRWEELGGRPMISWDLVHFEG